MFASDICLILYLANRFGSRPGKTTSPVEPVALFKEKTVLEKQTSVVVSRYSRSDSKSRVEFENWKFSYERWCLSNKITEDKNLECLISITDGVAKTIRDESIAEFNTKYDKNLIMGIITISIEIVSNANRNYYNHNNNGSSSKANRNFNMIDSNYNKFNNVNQGIEYRRNNDAHKNIVSFKDKELKNNSSNV
ncbi:hypothetical protein BCR32DRAFT_282866 [Anaeromyces robustus]|uniref:Uncharacterized protein n=1 Tax=Anaeromyces robustus TaxID=1754192 RepID=A0A1Y1WW55_9FUNG|nr:hypothetical protein BCR32DRAFT_282866 [Anaeromyces robustus]|eukprot:ORX77791.1 hypothetical protein BCR32DRAFT_282866 [Anaeromyces robustus]